MAKPRVLLLPGWSNGPLDYLRERFDEHVEFISPAIHTPPLGAKCWLNPYIVVLVFVFTFCVPFIYQTIGDIFSTSSWWFLCLVEVVAFWFFCFLVKNFIVSNFVRYAIQESVQISSLALQKSRFDAVVGFSWGGAIAWWLLCEEVWDGPTLMLAPTIEVMRSIAGQQFPVMPIGRGKYAQVRLFHAKNDPFCPDKQLEQLIGCGVVVYKVDDNHVLSEYSSNLKIERSFLELLQWNSKSGEVEVD
jgi:hypothetical protein